MTTEQAVHNHRHNEAFAALEEAMKQVNLEVLFPQSDESKAQYQEVRKHLSATMEAMRNIALPQ